MKKIFIRLIVAATFYSCSTSQETSNKESTTEQVSVTEKKELTKAESFQLFWFDFRKAAINKDFETLKGMTQFPLDTKGPMDLHENILFEEARFAELFELFLNEHTGPENPEELEINFIEKTEFIDISKEIEGVIIHDDEVNFKNMDFKLINKVWKLHYLLLEDHIYEDLEIDIH